MTILTVPDDYATIQLAYNAAQATGDKVYIKEIGSPYNEKINCLKQLKFEGQNTNTRWFYSHGAYPVLSCRAHNIEVSNLWLDNDKGYTVQVPTAVDNIHIHHNHIKQIGSSYPIAIGSTTNATIKVDHNDFYGGYNYGVYMYRPDNLCEIKNNIFHDIIKTYAIYSSTVAASKFEVWDNDIQCQVGLSTTYGIAISFAGASIGATSIKNNLIKGTQVGINGTNYGIRMVGAGNVEITGNKVTGDFKGYAIEITKGGYTIHWNDFVNDRAGNGRDTTDGLNNWDKDGLGNYWGYGGAEYDADGDAIGDDPYIIPTGVGNQDNFPLMCSIDIHPECPYVALEKRWCFGRIGIRTFRL